MVKRRKRFEALWVTQLHGNAPKRVVMVGTAPRDLGQGSGLSVPVETAVEATVEQILELLAQVHVRPTPRPEPTGTRGWWE